MDDFDADVLFQVWRNGGNPDRIDFDRVDDSRARGYSEDDAAARELTAQRRREVIPIEISEEDIPY